VKRYIRVVLLLGVFAAFGGLFGGPGLVASHAGPGSAEDLISGAAREVPIPGKVTMLDLGAHKCIPCKMMAPIIKEISSEYEGRAAIVFIDVWENPDVPQQYGIRAIPTQIFYDAQGKERFRHEGFLDKESIAAKLKELGAS